MKIGDYVRMNWGIDKVSNIYERIDRNIVFDTTNGYQNYFTEIIKSSPNIIDLIEVGDYVNGHIVEDLDDLGYITLDDDTIKYDDINSIVTKEQFKSMEYKIGDKE